MIRIANKFDMPKLIEMLWHYHDTGVVHNLEVSDEETAAKILTHIFIGGGIAIISEKDDKPIGMLLAIITPYLWDHSKFVMSEIAYWVEPEHRGSTAGYRMLKKYIQECDKMKEQGRIHNYTMSQMEGQTLDYGKFGMRPMETTWSI